MRTSPNDRIDVCNRDDNNKFILSSSIPDEEITFLDYSQRYCVSIIDMVNSTEIVAEITTSEKLRRYYSTFINTMAFLVKGFNAKIIKNVDKLW
jgi:hypothetical protein